MKKLTITGLSFIFMMTFNSCVTAVLRKVGALEDSARIRTITDGEKKLVYIPMVHIGRKKFYEDVKRKIDSLKKDGYVVYYEGVRVNSVDAATLDTINRKFRVILPIDIIHSKKKGGYIDTIENSLMGRKVKAIKKYNLVNQPSVYKLGIDTSIDIRADVTYGDIVNEYEKKYGKIILTECDLNTSLQEKYTCRKPKKNKKTTDVILHFRDAHLAKEILQDKGKKIAVIFGAKHFDGMLALLQQNNPAWK